MRHLLKRHPFTVSACLRRSLVLTYAYPESLLRPLPPGLSLDSAHGYGFLAIGLVQASAMRPSLLPAAFGHDFFVAGYRLFTRFASRRGFYVLRSDTDSPWLARCGNVLTRYRFGVCRSLASGDDREVRFSTRTPDACSDIDVVAAIGSTAAALPPESPFENAAEARRYAGPLPYTFDYEPDTGSIISVLGRREHWNPQTVEVEVRRNHFLRTPPFDRAAPRLAAAFYVHDVPYEWMRGTRTVLEAA